MDTRRRNDEISKRVIENYKSDEKMMVLVFAQWCVNNDVDPLKLYDQAYPNQEKNTLLLEVLEETVPKEQADLIDDGTLLNILQIFGNDDLAFAVQQVIDQRKSAKE